jgi:hypothetical protein
MFLRIAIFLFLLAWLPGVAGAFLSEAEYFALHLPQYWWLLAGIAA